MSSSIPVPALVPTAMTADAKEDPSDGDDSSSDPADTDPDESCDNWRFLQVCGVAHDVCTSTGVSLPLQVDQAVRSMTSVPSPADDISHLSGIATQFLQGLYQSHGQDVPVSRATMVYVCAIAMTYLYQPTTDSRMLLEFQRYIGAFRQSMGIDASYGRSECQILVMQYIKFASKCSHLYHYYGLWFNGDGQNSVPSSSTISDNYLEYSGSPRSLESSCYNYIRQFQTPVDCPVSASSNDFALFCTHQDEFYQRLVTDLDLLTFFLHRRYFCCVSICRDSQNTFRYMVALSRLDDIIAILAWIVSEYVVVRLHGMVRLHGPPNTGRVCMSRYDQHPYEHLLARAYNLRFMQSHDHTSSSHVYILYGYGTLQ